MARRLVIPKSARSEVWKYFGFEADESGNITDVDKRLGRRFVWCRLCDTQLLFSGNTTNLSSHISRCHRVKISQTERVVSVPVVPKMQNTNYREAQGLTEGHIKDFNESRQSCDIQQPDIETSVDEEMVDEVEHCPENNELEDQQYCLKWKHHHSNQETMFTRLLERESFCDVTIVCEEKLIRAHKLVLSACSSYFETVLSHYEDRNPIIILKDIKYDDMLTLIQFMYRGEANIVQNNLATFLETADVLKVRGLSDIYGESLSESSVPLDIPEEQQKNAQELSTNRINKEQGKRLLRDEETNRQVKVPRCSIGTEAIASITNESTEEKTAMTNASDKQDSIIRLPQFLNHHGSYQDFWKKPCVIKALKAVNDREMTLMRCSELLGVDYNRLYNRYRIVYGCLKEPLYENVPRTSRGYTLSIVNSYSKKETNGNIIVRRDSTINDSNNSNLEKVFLRGDQLASEAILNVKTGTSPSQGSVQSLVNVKVENSEQQYKYRTEASSECHIMESETSKIEDVSQV